MKKVLLTVLAVASLSLPAAAASLSLPRLFGHAVNQAQHLLVSGPEVRRALLLTALMACRSIAVTG
jgi:hypothetical protein